MHYASLELLMVIAPPPRGQEKTLEIENLRLDTPDLQIAFRVFYSVHPEGAVLGTAMAL